MTKTSPGKPTLPMLRARALELGIEIAREREAAILAGAEHLYDAANRLERIAADGDAVETDAGA